jgi:hypothetical protein
MISRLSERIVRLIPDSEIEKKKSYLESIAQEGMTLKLVNVPYLPCE